MQAGSLVYVRVKNGHDQAREEIWGSSDHLQQFWNGAGRQRVKENLLGGFILDSQKLVGSGPVQHVR